MDRTTETQLPDGTRTTMTYGFDLDRNGATLDTSYPYDALKQIVEVKDAKGNLTTAAYDRLGRRVSLSNPDTGLVTTVYDNASNPIQKITANLRASGKSIDYVYDFNRLAAIHYPGNPANDVTYTYGAPGAPFNQTGRVTKVTDASGSEERQYGKLGETVKEIRTIASHTQGKSANSPEVYTTQYAYDTFGRILTLTLPDTETVTYNYDAGGNLLNFAGVKGGATTPYLQTLLYDKFEQRTYLKLGNGIETRYTYDAANRRLNNLASQGAVAGRFQNLSYGYDKVGNILSLNNDIAIPAANAYGGPTAQTFGYDDLYRLTSAKGSYQFAPGKVRNYQLDMQYDDIHNIVKKTQADSITNAGGSAIPQKATSYDWNYVYGGMQPHAPTHIGNRTFSYDANGNQTGWSSDNNGTRRIINCTRKGQAVVVKPLKRQQPRSDEDNRISEILDNGDRNRYVYDAGGQRVIKIGRQGETVYVNQYYVVRNRSIASKHFFAGSSRIATRLVMGTAPGNNFRGNGGNANGGGNGGGNTNATTNTFGNGQGNNGNAYAYGRDKEHGQSGQEHGNNGANGNNDHSNTPSPLGGEGRGEGGKQGNSDALSMPSPQSSPAGGRGGEREKQSSTPEGYDVTGLPGHSDKGLENALANGQGHKYGIYKHLERAGLSVDATGEIVAAGTAGTTTANGQSDFTYYYHPDHLGSTGYVTDANGKLYEHTEYFPFGETWVQEHSNTLRTPYLFTGKELDQETGLYYFGARYYDPRTSVWQSADPILGKYLPSAGSSDSSSLEGMGGVYNAFNLGLYSYGHENPVRYSDPDGNVVIGIPFTDKYFVLQQKPGGGMRAEITTRAEGRHIDPAPTGLFAAQKIGFKNDVTTGPSTDNKVKFEAAENVEGAVRETNLDINVNSTTGGHGSGQHPAAEAVDINKVGGGRVSDPHNRANVDKLQKALGNQPNIFRNYGPSGQTETHVRGGVRTAIPVTGQAAAHGNHIHATAPNAREERLRGQ